METGEHLKARIFCCFFSNICGLDHVESVSNTSLTIYSWYISSPTIIGWLFFRFVFVKMSDQNFMCGRLSACHVLSYWQLFVSLLYNVNLLHVLFIKNRLQNFSLADKYLARPNYPSMSKTYHIFQSYYSESDIVV